jgi:hypothetical protein
MKTLLRRLRGGAIALAINLLAAAGPVAFVGVPLAIGLGGCAGVTASQAQTDIQTLATGLSSIVSALQSLPGNPVPASVVAQINSEIQVINSDAAQIGSAVTVQPSTAQQISAAVTAIAAVATPFFPAAPAVGAVVQAAVALVPTILAMVGVTGAAPTAPPAMSAAQARLILQDAAAHGIH